MSETDLAAETLWHRGCSRSSPRRVRRSGV